MNKLFEGTQEGNLSPASELPHLAFRERIADVLSFISSPTNYHARYIWNWKLVIAVLTVFVLDLAVDFSAHIAVELIDTNTSVIPNPVDFHFNPLFEVFSLIVFAPLLEEAVFRGWLTGRIAALRFGIIGFIALSLVVLPEYFWLGTITPFLPVLGLIVAVLGCAQWRVTRDIDVAVPAFFTRYYRWFVWGSAVAFALFHLGNYEPLTHPAGILVLLPLVVGGLFLAYTRTRLGLRAAMLHHALYNGVWLVTDHAEFGFL